MPQPIPAERPAGRPLLIYHLGLLLVTVIWASTFISVKYALQQLPPNTLAFLRFLAASLVLLPCLLGRNRPAIRRQDWLPLAASGLAGVTLYNFFQNQGLKYAGVTEAAILASMAPVFIALLARIFLKERISGRRAAGIVIAFLGSALVVTGGSLASLDLAWSRVWGDFLILLTGLAWAAYSISLKGILARYQPRVALALATLIGTALLLPPALLEWPVDLRAVDPAGWLAVLYLGLFASALAYLIWNAALTRIEAVTAGAYLYLIPLFAAAMGAILLGEWPAAAVLAGGLLVLLGTYFAGK